MNTKVLNPLAAALLCLGAAAAMAQTCSPKIGGASKQGIPACTIVTNASDTTWLIFDIDLQRTSIDSAYDPAHKAVLKSHVQDLYTKYDLRRPSEPDIRLDVPPDAAIDYSYVSLFMTKTTVLKMVNEPYITSVSYRSEDIHTSALVPPLKKALGPVARLPAFNAAGRVVGGKAGSGVKIRGPK
jgi:hypothetical protein